MVVMVSQKQKYFGVRDSNRFIRIYNKSKNVKIMQMLNCLHLWRVEILKRDMVDYWNDCFSDLHILDWKTIQRTADRAIVLCY